MNPFKLFSRKTEYVSPEEFKYKVLQGKKKQNPKRDEEQKDEKHSESGLRSQVQELNEKLDILTNITKEHKTKPFKMRWGIRSKLKKIAKKQMILVHLLRENRSTSFEFAKVEDGMIKINDKWRNCSIDFVWLLDGKYPEIILPEWSLQPIGTSDYYEALKNNSAGADAETVIINAMERAENESKSKFSPKILIWVLIGLAVVLFIVFGGQGMFTGGATP